MAVDPSQGGVYTDFAGLTRLKAAARTDGKAATEKVARQFETIFTQMMLKSMRSASLGEGAFDSSATQSYRDLYDQQMAVTLASRGKGLGIADMLVRQLGGDKAAPATGPQAFPIHGNAASGHALGTTVSAGFPVPARAVGMTAFVPTPATSGVSLAGQAIDAVQRRIAPMREAIGEAADAAASGARKLADDWLPKSPGEFVESLLPHAKAAAEKLGVSVRALLAHAALETGWGKHMPKQAGANSFNLFGIKAGSRWDGAKVTASTIEVENGVAVRRREAFRAYDSPADSFMDYARLLGENPRYAKALDRGEDVAGFARALQSAGYATDPHYAAKLSRIADSEPMREAMQALDRRAQVDAVPAPMTSLQLEALKISGFLPNV